MPLLSPQPVLIRLFCALALSATMLDVQAKTSPNTQTGAFVPFVGRWDGALEYKDYQGSGRVKVPVKLEVKLKDGAKGGLRDGDLASWNFVYDDFGKTVTSLETHSLVGKTYKVVTVGQKEVQTYPATALRHCSRAARAWRCSSAANSRMGKPWKCGER